MKESEYTELLVYFCLWNLEKFPLWMHTVCIPTSKARENLLFAARLTQTSPLKRLTSPSKTATSPGGSLGVACPSPGGSRPLTLAFCWGLEYVSVQNTDFTSKKGLLGPKKFFRTLSVRLLAGWF
ncbi:hypothetical protein DQM68_05940 [Leptospira mayottensis]|uniref:Uncharacterized protein n=2 Tax=Leptospira mayottensis TaxID=1137606 RepID=A0AA87MRM5_9LEPT|nr:hypothetical protein DQM68_05940 [Leptospira mayottensis]AZQ03266.1 hypothetical protein LEP1GSC190_15740 [Leptospira mayottensis 200901116]EKS01403.1 hypothetical protein LEP1GSC125_0033 [Leptospira mayottensis 200901122]AXR64082.1 hypothetical protein DQM28_07450 [Leptospira mayottensis]AXR64095.1 hypothetical protein DQM28_07530 [Leptospira mayottensis]